MARRDARARRGLATVNVALRPRATPKITSAVGDTTSALISGTTDPTHWQIGLDVAAELMAESAKTEGFLWGKGQYEEAIKRALRNFGDPKLADKATKSRMRTDARTMPIIVNGKVVDMRPAEFANRSRRTGAATNSMFNDEITNLRESVLVDAASATGDARVLNSVALTKMKLGWEKAIKPAGDFASYYGNVPRMATAARIAMSRSWKSLEEMDQAILEAVTRYHPTIQSLAAKERKFGRTMSTYYTWQRVAHIAIMDMAINRTSAMLFVPRVLSNIRQAQGIEQMSPGTPWADKQSSPDYLNYSVYGPIFTNSQYGLTVAKTSTMPLDIADNYQFIYDPILTPNQQSGQFNTAFGKLVGSNMNIVVERGIENVFGVAPRTGEKVYDRTLQGAVVRQIEDFGWNQLLKAGGFDVSGKEITPRKQELAKWNWLTGAKLYDVNTEQNQKNATEQLNARIKLYLENKANETK